MRDDSGSFINFAAPAAACYFFTPTYCRWLGYRPDWMAYIFSFLANAIVFFYIITPLFKIMIWNRIRFGRKKEKEKKYSENVSLRRLKGLFTDFVILAGFAVPAYFLGPKYIPQYIKITEPFDKIPHLYLGMASMAAFILFLLTMRFGKKWFGIFIKPFRFRRYRFGKGGSASFARMFDEWPLRYKRGSFLLGASLYSSSWKTGMYKLGYKDDRHIITIAGNRGGKGRSAIIPNLINWPHSALVIDPKGTNAAVTALRRGKGGGRVSKYLKQNVHVVDPFGIVQGVKSSCFNPLSAIDLAAKSVTEDIGMLADAIIVQEGGRYGDHFKEAAQSIIAGITAHLLTKNSQATLIDVRRALTQSAEGLDDLFGEMSVNDGAGGLPMVAASLLENAGDNERGAFFTTVIRNTKWIDSLSMKNVLTNSDFSLSDLKNGKTTVYVVLPPHMLDEHKRFMRLFVNLSLREMSIGKRAKKPVLFVLDEFFSLGALSQLEKSAGLMASYNVKLWPIVQNLSQLKELYPRNWETFLSNAGALQFFAINDLETEEYLNHKLGRVVSEGMITQLRETGELEEELSREGNRQIILRSGNLPLLLRRINYDKVFSKKKYSPDPDHPKS